jgi:group I intron endonuclease
MNDMNRTGVYQIINQVNNCVYIGSTSQGFGTRWKRHRKQLELGTHHSKYLQRAWNKHGEGAFSFHILEFVDSKDRILQREQYWIDLFLRNKPRTEIYNMSLVAGSRIGVSVSESSKAKISASLTGRKMPESQRLARMGKIASAETRAKMSATQSVRNFSDEHRSRISQSKVGKVFTAAHKQALCKIYPGFMSPLGVVYTNIDNLPVFCKEHELNVKVMRQVASGDKKSHKGWTRI